MFNINDIEDEIRDYWYKAFQDLRKLKVNRGRMEFEKEYEVRSRFTPRQMVGLYAVASICYDDGNHSPVIGDEVFDCLCKWIYKNYDECVKAGADKLDREELRCCSGIDTKKFVKPYHDIAEIFLGHQCRCVKCSREYNPNLN